MNRIKNNADASTNGKNTSLQIGLDIHAESPIILLPVAYNCNHLLIADLGKITLRNSFHFANNVDLLRKDQFKETTYNEIIDLMRIDLLNINLMTGEREAKHCLEPASEGINIFNIGNFCIIKLGETIFKEKCHLNIDVIRNTETDKIHKIPDIVVKATLSELNGLLNLQQYKLIRGLLNCNLGEAVDDVYYNYRVNLNESLERLCSITKVNIGEGTLEVWNTLSINFILDNVTISFADPLEHGNSSSEASNSTLACIKFIKSTLEIDSFSDGSQDIDLISSEILIIDARTIQQESPVKNCFKYILKPSIDSTSKSTVQAEIHSRKRNGISKYTVLLNNMRIMALFDYLERLKNFLNEEPFMSSSQANIQTPNAATHKQSRHSPKSSYFEDNLKYELVLNITNSEVVFVENCERSDTNAVILKSTTVFSYKPGSNIVPISVDINHLEIFSCILGSESASSLSIIDPFSLNMELRNTSFHTVIPNPVYLRVSYNDAMLFSRMLRSIPNQRKKNLTVGHPAHLSDFEKIAPLAAMGFNQSDCWTAMQICNNNINESAIWLSHKKTKTSSSAIKISNITLNANSVSICIIDDCLDADVPLLEISLSRLAINHKIENSFECSATKNNEAEIETVISSNYYNRRLSGWEPTIEAWECIINWKYSWNIAESLKRLKIDISSKQILKFNITSTFIELCKLVRENWTKDYFVRSMDSYHLSVNTNIRQRLPFVPFALKNLTGEPLLFKIFYSQAGGITRTEVNHQDLMCNWISANHGDIVPFDFGPQSKWRHLDSHKLNMHQILIQIHGWTLIGPISIDKVGTFFRYANFDTEYSRKTRIVFEIDLVGSAQKLITVRSALNIFNSTRNLFYLHMKLRNENTRDVVAIKPLEKITIPLRHIDSLIYLKPTTESELCNQIDDCDATKERTLQSGDSGSQIDEAGGVCTKSISWQNCILQDAMQDTHSCFFANKFPFYVLSEIKKDKFPVRETGPMPGHTITLLPPLRLKNLLCCDLLYKVNEHAHGRINASGDIEVYSINIKESFSLSITIDNYKLSGQLKIPMGHSGVVEPKLKLIDLLNREIFLRVSIQSIQGRGMEIFISAPIWIINKTGLPLIFRQEGINQVASGQFEEHEYAREVSPLMFSFSDQEGSPLLEFRLGKSYGTNNPVSIFYIINLK